ncbi:MAG TPA: gliding motility protein GldN [Chitinophagaceae bacterium]|nr:gliding motility protein GldN [Chitinophagaceae bacterium]
MNSRLMKFSLLLVVAAFLVAGAADAQTRNSKKKQPAPKKKNTTVNNANNNAQLSAPAKKDTVVAPPPMAEIKLDTIRKSLRNDNAIEPNLMKQRVPLTYEHIREDDAVYRQRLWREIDVHEKMNLPFVYKADDDNGNQRFLNIMLNAIKSGELTAFNASIDDRFTTPMTLQEIAEQLVGKPKVVQVQDWEKDPDGSKGITKDSVITEMYNPDKVEKFWIKEDVVFDKESSRMYVRILGIAPVLTIRNADGSFRDVTPIFWVYYPDMRPLLAKYEAYNGKNYGARLSWEELFESRMFASRIIKSTVENPYDLPIKAYINDPILRLLEGENIKEKIFNYEQDLWSY